MFETEIFPACVRASFSKTNEIEKLITKKQQQFIQGPGHNRSEKASGVAKYIFLSQDVTFFKNVKIPSTCREPVPMPYIQHPVILCTSGGQPYFTVIIYLQIDERLQRIRPTYIIYHF